jgi:hypothetical protein
MYLLLLLFYLLRVIYFILLAFRTHVLLCVRGGIVTPNLIYLFWDVTLMDYQTIIKLHEI